jgi:hypothetical protein
MCIADTMKKNPSKSMFVGDSWVGIDGVYYAEENSKKQSEL